MKKLILFIAFIGLTFSVNAQSKRIKEKASSDTEYVNASMKLSEVNKVFLYESLLHKYEAFSKKSKGISKEEKKALRKKCSKASNKTLSKNFSKAEIKQIEKLLKESNKKKNMKNKEKNKEKNKK